MASKTTKRDVVAAIREMVDTEMAHGGGNGLHECQECMALTSAARRAVLDSGIATRDLPASVHGYDLSIWYEDIDEQRAASSRR